MLWKALLNKIFANMMKTTTLKNGKIGRTVHFDLQVLNLRKQKRKL